MMNQDSISCYSVKMFLLDVTKKNALASKGTVRMLIWEEWKKFWEISERILFYFFLLDILRLKSTINITIKLLTSDNIKKIYYFPYFFSLSLAFSFSLQSPLPLQHHLVSIIAKPFVTAWKTVAAVNVEEPLAPGIPVSKLDHLVFRSDGGSCCFLYLGSGYFSQTHISNSHKT